jgi:mevalonate pyrophosphate decarboxylase
MQLDADVSTVFAVSTAKVSARQGMEIVVDTVDALPHKVEQIAINQHILGIILLQETVEDVKRMHAIQLQNKAVFLLPVVRSAMHDILEKHLLHLDHPSCLKTNAWYWDSQC